MREYKVEQAQINKLLDKYFPIKFSQSVISKFNTCENKMIEFGIEIKTVLTGINGIIVIIFQYYHCWGLTIIYLYFICLRDLCIFIIHKNSLTSFPFHIWLIQHCI